MSRRLPAVAASLASSAAMLAFWGADLVSYVRAKRAPVAAIVEPPNLVWTSAVLLAALGALGLCAFGLLQKRDGSYRGYRVAPILLLCAFFVELFVFGEGRMPFTSADRLRVNLQLFAKAVSQQSAPGQVLADPAKLSVLARAMGAPPYLDHGQPAGPFRVQVRQGCEGPVKEAPGSPLGTFLYCLAKDGTKAWVSVIALPAEETYGSPAPFTQGGIVQYAEVIPSETSAGSR